MSTRVVLAFVTSLIVALAVACGSDGDAPTATATPSEEPATPSATATATRTPRPTATPTSEPTATPEPTVGGPVIATIRAAEWPVWPDVVIEAEPLRTLTVGDQVEVDMRRWHWVHLVEGGWMPTDVTAVALSAAFESLPEFETLRYPSGTQTGLPRVDTIIDLGLATDGESLLKLAAFQDVECVQTGDPAEFVCPSGVAAGTVFSVFSFVGCHGISYLRDDAEQVIDAWSRDQLGLYAVYERADGTAIVLTRNGAAFTLALNRDGLLEYVDLGCGLLPPERVVQGVTDFILAPPEG